MKRRGLLLVAFGLVLAACGTSEVVAPTSGASTAVPSSSSVPATASAAVPEPASYHPEGKAWDLVWADEFDGTKLDLGRWSYERNCWGGGNNEMQCYTDSGANVAVIDGFLRIIAISESSTGLAVSEDSDEAATAGTKAQPYTSGRIRTKGKGDWRYGRFEIRARLPFGQGLWPAVWMLPTDSPYGSWAAGGEIDIMEAVNLKTRDGAVTRSVHGTLHYGAEWPANVFSGTFWPFGDDHPSDVFHVYALEWEEGEIRWYVDDVHYATQTDDGWYTQFEGPDGSLVVGTGAAPFDQPFHLILNLAVGGNWPGPPDEDTTFPQVMEVDYVRVYECSVSPADGRGCATVSDTARLVEGSQPTESIFTEPFTGDFDPAALGDVMAVFVDDQLYPWKLDSSVVSGGVEFELIDTGDSDHGSVIQISFDTNESVAFFQSSEFYDLSDWIDGFVEFDLRVLDVGSNTKGIVMKVDCGFPCGTGDFFLEDADVGEWTSYRIPVAGLVGKPGSTLDLTRVNTPLVIFPAWGNQRGVVMQVDNVYWTR